MKNIMTVVEVAHELGTSPSRVRNWIETGALKALTFGTHKKIRSEELARFLNAVEESGANLCRPIFWNDGELKNEKGVY